MCHLIDQLESILSSSISLEIGNGNGICSNISSKRSRIGIEATIAQVIMVLTAEVALV